MLVRSEQSYEGLSSGRVSKMIVTGRRFDGGAALLACEEVRGDLLTMAFRRGGSSGGIGSDDIAAARPAHGELGEPAAAEHPIRGVRINEEADAVGFVTARQVQAVAVVFADESAGRLVDLVIGVVRQVGWEGVA